MFVRVRSLFLAVSLLLPACHSGVDGGPLFPAVRGVRESAPRTGREVLGAFLKAYPDRFQEVRFQDGDWTISSGELRFYWANGKMLPENALGEAEKYSPHPFYTYAAGLPAVPEYTEEEKAQIRIRVDSREKTRLKRHPGIYNVIWRLSDRTSAERRIVTVRFLGLKVRVHQDIVPALAAIDTEINRRKADDPELERFVRGIQTISGQHWRTIANTASLSFHSYGVALDVIWPNPERKETYWLWAKRSAPDWFTLPLSRRLLPPASFIETFEKYGFVWGGKWFYFDTIHFEYRPEILLVSGLPVTRVATP
ncbi:MAG TPA: M15 family peptidase [Spirochaetia bacterium]|nr:M15 family peptidase [Spirochaetia bacterium]